MTKTSSFVLPTIELATDVNQLISCGFINSYLGDTLYTESGTWGERVYVQFDSIKLMESGRLDTFRSNPNYIDEYDPDTDTVMLIFSIPAKYKKTVIQPFIEGKYSLIDREYVKRYFPSQIWDGKIFKQSLNYKILTKHKDLKEHWEALIGVTLPEDAEVWSKIQKDEEIFKYELLDEFVAEAIKV